MAWGPKRAPGRCDVPPSNGAPMIMMSVPAHELGSARSSRSTPKNVASGPYMPPSRVMSPTYRARPGPKPSQPHEKRLARLRACPDPRRKWRSPGGREHAAWRKHEYGSLPGQGWPWTEQGLSQIMDGLDPRVVDDLVFADGRRLELEGLFNLRDVGAYPAAGGRTVRWRTLLRSDALHRLDSEGVTVLGGLGLRTI